MSDAELMKRAVNGIERIGMVLGALFASKLREEDQGQKVRCLHGCGYSNTQIAHLLGITTNAVNVALHRARKRKKATSAKKSKAK